MLITPRACEDADVQVKAGSTPGPGWVSVHKELPSGFKLLRRQPLRGTAFLDGPSGAAEESVRVSGSPTRTLSFSNVDEV